MSDLLKQLSSFEASERRSALEQLASLTEFPAESFLLNMHLHTFFSYHGEGWSPSRVAYEMKKLGVYSAAICDFDVLHGLSEFLAAGDLLRLRAAVAFESRVFFREYAQQEINSPGEPGVFYFMGAGFVSEPSSATAAGQVLSDMLARSHARNRSLLSRLNARLEWLPLDYDRDVLPLTPGHNPTERHLVRAYYERALATAATPERAAALWGRSFGVEASELQRLLPDVNGFHEYLRGKLMKRGGLGYEQPTEQTFPLLDTVIGMIREAQGIPMSAWLDGSLSGESDPERQLDLLVSKGVEAVNIIPDRNWNFKDSGVRAQKMRELERYVSAARRRDLPINVGTEGNKPGQRLVDDFAGEALRPYHPLFLDGARVVVGHTLLLRYAGVSYIGEAALALHPRRRERNRFFASVGALPPPDARQRERLQEAGPERALALISAAAVGGGWSF